MGKSKRIQKKIKENREEKSRPEKEKKITELEQQLRLHMEAEEYAEVLDSLAELVQLVKTNEIKPEFLYDGAYSYFMLGDYERASRWVDNVLSFDAGNIPARILLARICILEDRVDDGLAIFEYVLKNGKEQLTDANREEIEDIVSYYVRRDEDKIRKQYPSIAAFVGKQGSEENTAPKETPSEPQSSARDILKALKNKIEAAKTPEQPKSVPETSPQPETKPTELGSSAREILQALREKVLNGSANKSEQKPAETAKEQSAPQASQGKPSSAQEQRQMNEAASAGSNAIAEGVQEKKQAVLSQRISLSDKVRLLNAFAGGYYYQGDLAAAKELLTEALNIDSSDMTTLTNMTWVLLESGEKEKAAEFATQARVTDFGLIRMLRES
ncbi:MAG: hypothetical protein IKR28_00205 [Selenomonadaceae bacterium]|nr:hypothetical protein [Selenomonadaceae bacterium]